MSGVKHASREIRKARTIVIAGHVNPDGDSIGSLLSLGLGLAVLKKKAFMVSSDGVPQRYRFLPGASFIKKRVTQPCDLAISVDCSNKEILGPAYENFKKAKRILTIDHHEFRRPFAHTCLIDKKAAAVGEIVYSLLKHLRVTMNRSIAMNLLTSIIVETNSFRLPHYRPYTFAVCAELLKQKVNLHTLSNRVFWAKNRSAAVLLGICLSRTKFSRHGRIAWSVIRTSDFKKVKGKDEDVDMAADELRAIEGVRIAILFREKSGNTLRLSLRSKGKINVAGIAERFGGGGHFDVAGCVIPNTAVYKKKVLREAGRVLR